MSEFWRIDVYVCILHLISIKYLYLNNFTFNVVFCSQKLHLSLPFRCCQHYLLLCIDIYRFCHSTAFMGWAKLQFVSLEGLCHLVLLFEQFCLQSFLHREKFCKMQFNTTCQPQERGDTANNKAHKTTEGFTFKYYLWPWQSVHKYKQWWKKHNTVSTRWDNRSKHETSVWLSLCCSNDSITTVLYFIVHVESVAPGK